MEGENEGVVGARFGELVVTKGASRRPDRKGDRRYFVKCDCGAVETASRRALKQGKKLRCRTCAAKRREASAAMFKRLNMDKLIRVATKEMDREFAKREADFKKQHPKEYRSWQAARQRTGNPKHQSWNNYGGRGVRMADRWVDDFPQFYMDMGPAPSPEHSLDRIDPNGHYEPENCRWATVDQQTRNRRILQGDAYTAVENELKQLRTDITELRQMLGEALARMA